MGKDCAPQDNHQIQNGDIDLSEERTQIEDKQCGRQDSKSHDDILTYQPKDMLMKPSFRVHTSSLYSTYRHYKDKGTKRLSVVLSLCRKMLYHERTGEPPNPALPPVKRGRVNASLKAPPSLRGRGLGWGVLVARRSRRNTDHMARLRVFQCFWWAVIAR